MFGPIHNIIFDLDGTLVNTMPSVMEGLSRAVELGIGQKPDDAELLASFGPDPRTVLAKWIAEPDKLNEAHKCWLDFEMNLSERHCAAFPEVEELLAFLSDAKIGMTLFTGRDRVGTLKILSARKWGKYFTEERICCGDDGLPPKPAPDYILKILSEQKWNPENVLMVGDHPHDANAGIAAGVKTAAALWDRPPGKGTERSRFREVWTKWDGHLCDVRLSSPLSLKHWILDN